MAVLCLLPATAYSPPTMAQDNVNTLDIYVEGAHPAKGQILLTLFRGEDNYMKTPIAEQVLPVAQDGTAAFTINELGSGLYALSIIHDKDGDGKLDTNFLGIPTEKVGFSNNARPKMGPAPWDKARFSVGDEPVVQTIQLGAAKRKK